MKKHRDFLGFLQTWGGWDFPVLPVWADRNCLILQRVTVICEMGAAAPPIGAAVRINDSLLWGTCLTHRETVMNRSVQKRRESTHNPVGEWVRSHTAALLGTGWPQVILKALGESANRSGSDSECLVSTGDLQQDCPRPGMDKRPLEGWCPWNRTWASS